MNKRKSKKLIASLVGLSLTVSSQTEAAAQVSEEAGCLSCTRRIVGRCLRLTSDMVPLVVPVAKAITNVGGLVCAPVQVVMDATYDPVIRCLKGSADLIDPPLLASHATENLVSASQQHEGEEVEL